MEDHQVQPRKLLRPSPVARLRQSHRQRVRTETSARRLAAKGMSPPGPVRAVRPSSSLASLSVIPYPSSSPGCPKSCRAADHGARFASPWRCARSDPTVACGLAEQGNQWSRVVGMDLGRGNAVTADATSDANSLVITARSGKGPHLATVARLSLPT